MRLLSVLASVAAVTLVQRDELLRLCEGVDIRELTISTAHALFLNGTLTSRQLTNCYIRRVNGMNPALRAVMEINPDARAIARRLDAHLKEKGLLVGPLHGIPILLDDTIATGDRMNTTAGLWALLDAKPKEDAEVVARLRGAGAILLGKSNIVLLAGQGVGSQLTAGDGKEWSERGGRIVNPYRMLQTAHGSGSAVAVATNLAMAALGTEMGGALLDAASAASVVGIKASVGTVSCQGVVPLAPSFGSVGVLARTVRDGVAVSAAISNSPFLFTENPYYPLNLRVAMLEYPGKEYQPIYDEMLGYLAGAGVYATAVKERFAQLPLARGRLVLLNETKHHVNTYLSPFNKSLQDIVQANPASPMQEFLLKADRVQVEDDDDDDAQRSIKKEAEEEIEDFLDARRVHVILAPSTPALQTHQLASWAGDPILTIPVGASSAPFGLSIYSRWGNDQALYALARLIDSFSIRHPPTFLRS